MKFISIAALGVLLLPLTYSALKGIDKITVSTNTVGETLAALFVIWASAIGIYLFGFFTGKEKP